MQYDYINYNYILSQINKSSKVYDIYFIFSSSSSNNIQLYLIYWKKCKEIRLKVILISFALFDKTENRLNSLSIRN